MQRTRDHYNFDGIIIAVSGDSQMSAVMHSRLKHFAIDTCGQADFNFEFYDASDYGAPDCKKPIGQARLIYEPEEGEVLYFKDEDQLYISCGDRVKALCKPNSGEVQLFISDPRDYDLWLISRPVFAICLMELLKRKGRYHLHAAGLCCDGKGILIPGTSGAGKSTLSLILTKAGFGFLGDDKVFLASNGQGFRAVGFPDEVNVSDQTISLLPELHHMLEQPKAPGRPKRQLRVEEIYGAYPVRECQIAVMVFPAVADLEKSVIKPMSKSDALLEIAPNVLMTEFHSSQAHLNILAELVSTSECYRLATGRDLAAIPMLFRQLVS